QRHDLHLCIRSTRAVLPVQPRACPAAPRASRPPRVAPSDLGEETRRRLGGPVCAKLCAPNPIVCDWRDDTVNKEAVHRLREPAAWVLLASAGVHLFAGIIALFAGGG